MIHLKHHPYLTSSIVFCRLITMLHALHRSTYMGERMTYYDRRQEVCTYIYDIIISCNAYYLLLLFHAGDR